jgi:hypothetical protein
MGLPRVVPPSGLAVSGRYYKEGSILSVPSFTIHRAPDVWGEDVEAYRYVIFKILYSTHARLTFLLTSPRALN